MKRYILYLLLYCAALFTQANCQSLDVEVVQAFNPNLLLSQRYSPAHLFIDKIDGVNQLIPSQSLFDIEISHRLGFNVIELNIHQTLDGEFICIHGVDGMFGKQVEHIDGATDISNTYISSVPLSFIQKNVRYKSLDPKYRTTIPTLDQCCELCKKLGMSISLSLTAGSWEADIQAIEKCKKWFGNNFMVCAYGDDLAQRARIVFAGLIMNWTPTLEPQDIASVVQKVGEPYIHCIQRSKYSDETSDETFKAIADAIHSNGGYAGFSAAYTPESLAQRMWNCGFDIAGPSYKINEFEGGNICKLHWVGGCEGFLTNGTVIDGVLTLASTETIAPNFESPSVNPFLSGGILKIEFSGAIQINMGHINDVIKSDGSKPMILTTYFLSQKPTFSIRAKSNTTIKSLSYQANSF